MDALVTDVHTRSAVAGLRALGRAGLGVIAVGPGWGAAGLWSRHAARRSVAPDVIDDSDGFARTVGTLATEHRPSVVYPVQEESLDALLHHGASASNVVTLPYADAGSVDLLRDKRRLASLAETAGLRTPAIQMEGRPSELSAERVRTPCVVKSVLPERGLALTHVIESRQELSSLLTGLPANEPLLVQERVEGPLMALALVLDRRLNVVARFQQVAKRTWPSRAGASSLATSVAPDHDLVERGARLLADAGYFGLAQLQFVRGPRGPALVDVNPRFYGSLPLALACGLNLPATWHAVVTERPVPQTGRYRVGVTYRWLDAELTAAVRESPRYLLDLAPRPRAGAMWSTEDPVPGAILAAHAVGGRIAKRVLHGRRR